MLSIAIIGKNIEITRNACEMTTAPRNNDASGSTVNFAGMASIAFAENGKLYVGEGDAIGLARAAAGAGAVIHEHSPAIEVDTSLKPFVRTAHGTNLGGGVIRKQCKGSYKAA